MSRVRWLAAVAAVGVVSLSACGSNTKATSSSGSGGEAKGSPIKVFSIVTPGNSFQTQPGMELGVKEINATGGIHGRPIELSVCSDQNSPAQAASCARQAIGSGAVAEIFRTTSFGASVNPIEKAEGIPVIGGGPFSSADFDDPNTFFTDTGTLSAVGSAVLGVKVLGGRKIGVPYVGIPSGATLAPTINPLIKPLGATTVGVIPIAETAADLTSAVASEIQAKPDVIVDGLFQDTYLRFIQEARQEGSKVPFLISSSLYDPAQMSAKFGKNFQGLYVDALYNITSPGFAEFKTAQQKYNPSLHNYATTVLGGWLSIHLLAYAGQHAPALTSKGLSAALSSTTNWNFGGLTPPLNFAKPTPVFGGKITRLPNNTLLLYKFNDGSFIPVGKGGFVPAIP